MKEKIQEATAKKKQTIYRELREKTKEKEKWEKTR